MPKNKDLKRTVRRRMAKTGESYTSARSHITKKTPLDEHDLEQKAGIQNASVEASTGKRWREWVEILDASGASSKTHRDIAKWVHEVQGVTSWWAQSVTVGYERIRGLRDTGQRRGGGFDVNKSKTLPVPLRELYEAFGARGRKQWLGEVALRVKKATPEKSMRWIWDDTTPVEIYFWEKGPQKSQVQIQHRELESKASADRVRSEWGIRLDALSASLPSHPTTRKK